MRLLFPLCSHFEAVPLHTLASHGKLIPSDFNTSTLQCHHVKLTIGSHHYHCTSVMGQVKHCLVSLRRRPCHHDSPALPSNPHHGDIGHISSFTGGTHLRLPPTTMRSRKYTSINMDHPPSTMPRQLSAEVIQVQHQTNKPNVPTHWKGDKHVERCEQEQEQE